MLTKSFGPARVVLGLGTYVGLVINSSINIDMKVARYKYTAHKKFMNGFACRGFDPYVAIISTSRCQKTPVCKSAK